MEKLDEQINELNVQIKKAQASIEKLEADIAKTESELSQKRAEVPLDAPYLLFLQGREQSLRNEKLSCMALVLSLLSKEQSIRDEKSRLQQPAPVLEIMPHNDEIRPSRQSVTFEAHFELTMKECMLANRQSHDIHYQQGRFGNLLKHPVSVNHEGVPDFLCGQYPLGDIDKLRMATAKPGSSNRQNSAVLGMAQISGAGKTTRAFWLAKYRAVILLRTLPDSNMTSRLVYALRKVRSMRSNVWSAETLHEVAMDIVLCFINTGVELYDMVMKELENVELKGGETKNQFFVRFMLSVTGEDAFVLLFDKRWPEAAKMRGKKMSYRDEVFFRNVYGRHFVFFFDESVEFRGQAQGIFQHLQGSAVATESNSPDKKDAEIKPLMSKNQLNRAARKLPMDHEVADDEVDSLFTHSPPSTPIKSEDSKEPSQKSTPLATVESLFDRFHGPDPESKERDHHNSAHTPAVTSKPTPTDAFYGIRLSMLYLLACFQTVVMAGTSAETWTYFKSQFSSPIRQRMEAFSDIPLLTPKDIETFLRHHFTIPEHYITKIAETFWGRGYFFFCCFLEHGLFEVLSDSNRPERSVDQVMQLAIDMGVEKAKSAVDVLLSSYKGEDAFLLRADILAAVTFANGHLVPIPDQSFPEFEHVVRGLAYMQKSETSANRVCEPFVRAGIRGLLQKGVAAAHDEMFKYLGRLGIGCALAAPQSTVLGNMTEVGVAHSFMRVDGPLFVGLPGVLTTHEPWVYQQMLTQVTECGTCDHLGLASEPLTMASLQPHQLFFAKSRVGIDIGGFTKTDKTVNELTFMGVQIKALNTYLTIASFLDALFTTSPGAFYLMNDERRDLFHGRMGPMRTTNALEFHQQHYHLRRAIRVVVSINGFSHDVLKMVRTYNKTPDGKNFPIVLITGSRELLGPLFSLLPTIQRERAEIEDEPEDTPPTPPNQLLRFAQVGAPYAECVEREESKSRRRSRSRSPISSTPNNKKAKSNRSPAASSRSPGPWMSSTPSPSPLPAILRDPSTLCVPAMPCAPSTPSAPLRSAGPWIPSAPSLSPCPAISCGPSDPLWSPGTWMPSTPCAPFVSPGPLIPSAPCAPSIYPYPQELLAYLMSQQTRTPQVFNFNFSQSPAPLPPFPLSAPSAPSASSSSSTPNYPFPRM